MPRLLRLLLTPPSPNEARTEPLDEKEQTFDAAAGPREFLRLVARIALRANQQEPTRSDLRRHR